MRRKGLQERGTVEQNNWSRYLKGSRIPGAHSGKLPPMVDCLNVEAKPSRRERYYVGPHLAQAACEESQPIGFLQREA